MIDDLDEVLRQLLIRDLPIKNGEVDIAFDQPKREWSARISRPTLNLFIYDLHENTKLRYKEHQLIGSNDRNATQQLSPVMLDLHYMITAWAAEPEDEHHLLTRTMMVLCRISYLPDDLLPESLQDQPMPITLATAQPEGLRNLTDIWSVLDNEMRPAIDCTVTLAINPYKPVTAPLVRTRELRVGQAVVPALPSFLEEPSEPVLAQLLDQQAGHDEVWTIGGNLHSDRPLEDLGLTLVERGLYVPILPGGRFTIGNLRAGRYTLEVSVKGKKPLRHQIAVPAPDYDIEV